MYDPETYYNDRMTRAPTDYEGEYDYDDDGRTIAGDMIALDGRTEYGLTQYGDGMTAVLADGMTTNVLPTSRAQCKPAKVIIPLSRYPLFHDCHLCTPARRASHSAQRMTTYPKQLLIPRCHMTGRQDMV